MKPLTDTPSRHAKRALMVVVASAIYFALSHLTVGSFFGWAPGLEWWQGAIGSAAGTRVWSHAVHGAALFIAAVPAAILLGIFGRPYAPWLAAATGVVVAAAAFVPSLVQPAVRLYMDTAFYAIAGLDALKTVLILMLLTWLVGGFPAGNAAHAGG